MKTENEIRKKIREYIDDLPPDATEQRHLLLTWEQGVIAGMLWVLDELNRETWDAEPKLWMLDV